MTNKQLAVALVDATSGKAFVAAVQEAERLLNQHRPHPFGGRSTLVTNEPPENEKQVAPHVKFSPRRP